MVDAQFAETFDFFYLPVDFKNKCSVGYAFVNFIDCQIIPAFMNAFDNKRWERFNSDKVCKVTYARLQGKEMLMDHFKSSSIMQQHKNLRPFFRIAGDTPPVPPGFAERSTAPSDTFLLDALENWSDTSSCFKLFEDEGGSVRSWASLLNRTPDNPNALASILGPPPGLNSLLKGS